VIAVAHASRHERLRAGIRERGCEVAVLVGPSFAAHLLGYQRLWSGPVAQIVAADGGTTAVVPRYEVEAATRLMGVDEVLPYGAPGFGLDPNPTADLARVVAAQVAGRPAALASDLPGPAAAITEQLGAPVEDIAGLMAEIRLLKDEDEMARLARAYELSLAAEAAVGRGAVPGVSEIELYSAAQATAQIEAGSAIEFGADLQFGKRTAQVCCPVVTPGRHRAEDGDVVVSDISVRHGGYWGDTARTFVIGENAEAREVLASIRAILDRTAAEMLRPGTRAQDVFDFVAGEIAREHPAGEFPHHAGHGVGITGYEAPHLVPGDETVLSEGMVFSVEPGVYFAGRFGVRWENTYAVTPDGGLDLRDLYGS
jgi:Xaa-Pro aminopeptidase